MKIEAAVFPFHERMLPFVRHFNQAQDTYHICQAIAWSGLGLNGRDVAFICRHPNIGIPVVSPTEPETFINWQVLLVDCDMLEQAKSSFDFFAFFELLLSAGKQIIVTTRKSGLSSSDKWNDLFLKYFEQIQVFTSEYTTRKSLFSADGEYRPLSVPVIMVGGLITQEDCLEIILALRESLTRQGEVVSCLTGSNMGLLMGMHSYTHIFASAISEEEKVIALKRQAQNIVQTECPSLLIVEAPDPMLKYNNAAPNGFGIQTYMACQALNPDALVCSAPSDMAMAEGFLDLISKDFENRYGVPITAVHASNVVIDSFGVLQFHKISRVHSDGGQASSVIRNQRIEDQSFPTFDVISDGADELAQLIFR